MTFAGVGCQGGEFVYYNRRPDGKHLEDCVCRAISTATGIDYNAVNELLNQTARENNCEKLCVCCYHNLLEGKFGFQRQACHSNETVAEIAREFPKENLIIRIHEHLTCAIGGKVFDIWDCTGKTVDCFWIVK